MTLRLTLLVAAAWILGCAAPVDTAETASGAADTNSDTHDDTGGDDTGNADGNSVVMETTLGTFTIELDTDAAPVTTENFLTYVDDGFYDGDDGEGATIFHRVLAGFVAQGGGYDAAGGTKTTRGAIELESKQTRSNLTGTIAMARTTKPDTATSQFYFNLVDNTSLDYASSANPGYAVFGEVTDGWEVVEAMEEVSVVGDGVPVEDIVITDCERE